MTIPKIYSTHRTPTTKQNTLIDVMKEVKPQLGLLNTYFANHHYDKVIQIYEDIVRKYSGFKTDLGKIAYSYYKVGRYREAEKFLTVVIDQPRQDHLLLLTKVYAAQQDAERTENTCLRLYDLHGDSTGYLVLGDVYRKLDRPIDAFHAYTRVLLKCAEVDSDDQLQLKTFSALATLLEPDYPGEAESYLYMALHHIPADVQTLEFTEIMDMTNACSSFRSPRIVQLLNKIKNPAADKETPQPERPAEEQLAEIWLRLFRRGAETMAEWKNELEEQGDLLLRTLNAQLETEQPSFARAMAV